MKEVEAEHFPVLGVEGMDVVVDAEIGYLSNPDPSLNSEDNACKQRWATQLY